MVLNKFLNWYADDLAIYKVRKAMAKDPNTEHLYMNIRNKSEPSVKSYRSTGGRQTVEMPSEVANI